MKTPIWIPCCAVLASLAVPCHAAKVMALMTMPFETAKSRPFVSVTVNGKPVKLLADLAADQTIALTRQDARTAVRRSAMKIDVSGQPVIQPPQYKTASLRFGAIEAGTVNTAPAGLKVPVEDVVLQQGSSFEYGLIGIDALKGLVVSADAR